MSSRLKGLQVRFPCIGDVRALGAMVAIELVKNARADAPDAELTKALVQAAGRHGLMLLSCGIYAQRDPLSRAADDPRCAAEGRLPPVRAGARGGRRRRRCSARPRAEGVAPRALNSQARPALASVGVWKYSLSEASCSIRRFSSAMRPCAVLMGMQSWQRGSPHGWREYSQYWMRTGQQPVGDVPQVRVLVLVRDAGCPDPRPWRRPHQTYQRARSCFPPPFIDAPSIGHQAARVRRSARTAQTALRCIPYTAEPAAFAAFMRCPPRKPRRDRRASCARAHAHELRAASFRPRLMSHADK